MTICGIVVGLGMAIVLIFVEIGGERLFDRLLRLLGLESGEGPLEVRAAVDGARVVLTVQNRGKHKIRLAGIEGRDASQRRVFPTPMLDEREIDAATAQAQLFKQLARVVLGPDESRRIMLDRDELVDLNCRALAILDSDGRSWPVDGFDATELDGSA
jgi:hypothetical protein